MKKLFYLTLLALSALQFRPASAADKVLVLLNSRDEMNFTARLAREGVRLAVEEWKHHSRTQKLPEFVQVDFDDNVMKAASDIQAAVMKYRPIAMIGTIRSDHAIVAAEIAERERIPFVTPLSTNPKVTEGRKYTLRTCFDDNVQAESLAAFIVKERGRRRVAIIYNEGQVFTAGFRAAIEARLSRFKQATTLAIPFSSGEPLSEESLKSLRVFSPDSVVISAYQIEAAGLLTKLSRSLPINVEFYGPDSWGGGRIFHAAVGSGGGARIRSFYAEHWAKEFKSAENIRFLRVLKSRPPSAKELRVSSTADLGPVVAFFEVTELLLSALRSSQTQASLLDSIRQMQFRGPRGVLKFSGANLPAKPIHIFGISGGAETYVGAYSIETGLQK